MFVVRNLVVMSGKTRLINGLNLKILKNQTIVIFGPNGSGKSTFLRSILGLSEVRIVGGEIFLDGKALVDEKISKISVSIGYMMQHPPSIQGLSLASVMSESTKHLPTKYEKYVFTPFMKRDVNYNLSGGERKLCELYQLYNRDNLKMLLLDEPDSGVDIENIGIVADLIQRIRDKNPGLISIIVTHNGEILNKIRVEKAYVMIEGEIICAGEAQKIYKTIRENGYSKCLKCKLINDNYGKKK